MSERFDVGEAIKWARGTISAFDRATDGLPYNEQARMTLLLIRAAENWQRVVDFVEHKERKKHE